MSKNETHKLVYQIYLSIQDPQHAAGINQNVVPFNRVQFIKEAPENIKSEQEKLEKWAQGDMKDDGKYDSQPPKEADQHDTKKEKNNRSKDCIGKRAFVPEQEICGTVKFLGKPAGGSKVLYGIETVTSYFITTWVQFGKIYFKIFNCDVFLLMWNKFLLIGQIPFFLHCISLGNLQIYLGLTNK